MTDTDQTRKARDLDNIYVDRMFIRSEPGIAGDANLDGTVDAADYLLVKRSLGLTGGASWFDGDFDGDGAVDYGDLNLLTANMGRTIPTSQVASTEEQAAPPAETAALPASPAAKAHASAHAADVLKMARRLLADPLEGLSAIRASRPGIR